MSNFKFACPVCGQHITADPGTSGKQIECPTCFQKIVVPQAPESGEAKFILSASQVGKPRPLPAAAAADSLPRPISTGTKFSLAGIAFVILALAAGAGLFVFRKQIFKPGGEQAQKKAPARQTAQGGSKSAQPAPTGTNWTLDLGNATLPEWTAAGLIHGSNFVCQRATVEGRTLALRQGAGWPPPLGLTLVLSSRPVEDLSGQTAGMTPDQSPPGTRAVLRWKDEQQQDAKAEFRTGYAFKLAFGQPTNGVLPGKIYICLPDQARSFVAGAFEAEIRKPPPPKVRWPKAPK